MKPTIRVFSALLAFLLLGTPAHAVLCTLDEVPAATLLFPFVAADVSDAACAGAPASNTRLTITNTSELTTLIHVTMWSDQSVPVVDFDLYLTGYDVENLDFHEMFCPGNLPATGSAVSSHGDLSGPAVQFPSCNNTTTPGSSPNWGPGVVTPAFRGHLKAWLTGNPSPLINSCAGAARGNTIAHGYVTVDVVQDCNILFPSDPSYHTGGIIGFDNVLTGSYTLFDAAGTPFATLPAVHIEAAPAGFFVPGDHTFYGRYVGATAVDRREPLPNRLGALFFESGPFDDTELLVWREGSQATAPYSCALPGPSAWYPLPAQATLFDHEENALAYVPWTPNEVDRYSLTADAANPFAAGWVALDLRHDRVMGIYGDDDAQGWAVVVGKQGGVERAAWNATVLAPLCTPPTP